MRCLDRSTKRIVIVNDCSDLKSTTLAGRSVHTFTALMLKKEVLALHPLKGFKGFYITFSVIVNMPRRTQVFSHVRGWSSETKNRCRRRRFR